MKIKFYALFLTISTTSAIAQVPEDALRLSWFHGSGSARNQAIGGAMGSLGGDASANHINPAGLGFFRTSDLILTPAWKFGKGKANFRGTNASGESFNGFNLGTTGIVIGGIGAGGNGNSTAFGLTVTKLADFNQSVLYSGQNNYSSFAEPLADEFALSGLTIDQALNSGIISFQTKMALYNYLVDTARVNGNLQVIARSENPSNRNQQQLIDSKGGITEIGFGFGGEVTKKFLAGISLGIPIIKLERNSSFFESDATGDQDNDFSFLNYAENMTLKGVGANLKAGIIFRPKDYVRLGFAVHTPSFMLLKETFQSGLAVDVEQLFGAGNGYDSVSSTVFSNGQPLVNKYQLNTPVKLMISGAYVFREEENVARQKGFITADIEYTNYKWLTFGPQDENTAKEVYDPYNQAVDAIYKGAFNFRVGGELKFKTIMARAGFAYYGSPYKEKELKARKMNISGGLGYRHKGMFIDLTYVHALNKDVHFPYRVNSPRANTFAELKDNGGNVLLTLGFKI